MGKSICVGRVSNSDSSSKEVVSINLDLLPCGPIKEKGEFSARRLVASALRKIKDAAQIAKHKIFQKTPKIESKGRHIVVEKNGKYIRKNIENGKTVSRADDGYVVKEGISRIKERIKSKDPQNKIR